MSAGLDRQDFEGAGVVTAKGSTNGGGRHVPETEAGVEGMCATLIDHGKLLSELGLPSARSVKRQYRLGNSPADIVIEHVDGSVTIIEVKNQGLGVRDYCTGIGQLAYYSVMAMIQMRAKLVRRYLAIPGAWDVDLLLMCAMSDVEPLPLPTIPQWNAILSDEIDKAIRH